MTGALVAVGYWLGVAGLVAWAARKDVPVGPGAQLKLLAFALAWPVCFVLALARR